MNKKLLPLLILALSLPSLSNGEGLLKYNPPKLGAPLTLTGGGTRGLSQVLKQVQVLAPRHTALTSQSQPVLYWYAFQAKQQKVEVTLVKEGDSQPLLQKQLGAISTEGLQNIRLADYGVSLQPGEEYRWSVVINNAEQGSGEIISSATLRYQVPEAPLFSAEQQAEAGYWYDALQQLIENHSPLANDLLEQGGLKIPAL